MKRFLIPFETAIETSKKCVFKSNMKFIEILLLGILGGFFISLGAHGSIVISQTLGNIDEGLMKFASASIIGSISLPRSVRPYSTRGGISW